MTEIHDQTYRRYAGKREPMGRAWTVIAWAGIRHMLGRKMFLALMLLAWIPFIARAVQIYAVTMWPQARDFLPINTQLFQRFVEQQGAFVFFICIYVGSGLIANDRRANALQIYLSKPLLRMEYIAGKLAVLLFFLLEATLLPALMLVALQVAFSGNLDFVRNNLTVIPAILLSCLVRVIVAAVSMLALSSLSKSTRYVSVLYAGIIFFTEAVYGVLTFITGSTRVAWVSITANLDNLSDAIFRQPARYETPVLVSLLVLAAVVAVSLSVLERRVRGVEVVS
jgi:ABC-type transport system involved in multi-copper enzyme maturation permease subunit